MAGPFPCPNTPSTCDTNANPATTYSSEAVDSTTFIGIQWNNVPPALGAPFTSTPCEAIAESQISQADADRIAANQAVTCSNPCANPVFNTAQTASANCPDGSDYSFTVPAGLFTADNQVLADRKAFGAAVQALRGHQLCLGSVAPASVCRGEFYFGIISVITTDNPVTLELIAGDLPDGLSFTFESTRVVIQGTPHVFGSTQFTIRATSSAGIVATRDYTVSVTGIVTASVLNPGTEDTSYSTQLTAVTPPSSTTTWAVVSGALPDGLSLDAGSGVISGTPTTPGDSTFTIGMTAAGNTCNKQFSIHVAAGVIPPHCISDTAISFNTLTGTPDGPFNGTRVASVQRLVLVDSDDGKVVFINTATNAVINTITLATGYVDGQRFKHIAFATSTQNFFFIDAGLASATVTDINGNVVGSLAAPPGYNFGKESFAYSPDADKLYTVQNNAGNDHILEFDPHTLTLTRDSDTGTAGYGGVFCYPGNVVAFGFAVDNYPISTLVKDKGSGFFAVRGEIDYDPVSQRLFVGNQFGDDIAAFLVSDFSFDFDFVGAVNVGPYQWISYNPVTKSIIALNPFLQVTVIDPSNNTIICELQNVGTASGGMALDYSTGDVYFFQEDGGNNPVDVWS